MDNLSFLPQKIEEKYKSKKIKTYKSYVFSLWVACLVLFLIFVYVKYRRDQFVQSMLTNTLKHTEAAPKPLVSKDSTVSTLDKFINNFSKDLRYKSAVINDKQINLDIIIDDKLSYYKLIRDFENMSGISIVQISPIKKDEDMLTFELVLGVK